ncbi:MAG: 3-isopropylmalate dehydratase small subunit [Gammaproteobacteria bacterium]
MKQFVDFTGVVAPLNKSNVDTDQIIPKQYLKSIKRTGFGVTLFDQWRYLDEGQPGLDHTQRPENPDFVLNQAAYRDSSILVAGQNFGCGSSREHAPWALVEYGFKVIIAPSFADIFYINSFKNGLLLIEADATAVAHVMRAAEQQPGYTLSVSLQQQCVRDDNGFSYAFEIDPFRKMCMLEGLDDIGLTLKAVDDIKAYEQRRKAITPWMFTDLN